jgi:hypothetical protein
MILAVLSPARAQLDHFRIFDADSASNKTAGAFFNISIYALDASGNIVSTYNGTTILSEVPWGVAYITPQSAAFTNGVCNNLPVALLRAGGLDSIRCDDGLSHIGYSHGYTILAGVFRRLEVLLPGQTPDPGNRNARGRNGTPPSVTAGERFQARIWATDSLWNPLSSGDVVQYASTDIFARLPANRAMVGGRDSAMLSLRAAGTSRVLVSDMTNSGIWADTSTSLTVMPAPFEKLLLFGPGETALPGDTTSSVALTPGKGGQVQPQLSGDTFGIAAQAVDSCWNLVDTVNGDYVRINALNLNPVIIPPTAPLAGGRASYRVTVSGAGDLFLYARDENVPRRISDSYALDVPIGGRTFRITVSPDSVLSGDAFRIDAAYITSQGDTLHQDLFAKISAVLRDDTTRAGTGTFSDTLMLLTNGVGSLSTERYSVSQREAIRIKLRNDTLGASGISGNSIMIIPILLAGEQIVNYPNPFGYNQPTTTIRYVLSADATVNFTIYDLFGNPVWHRQFAPGTPGGQKGPVPNSIVWDGKNEKGREVGSGTYVLRVVASNSAETVANFTRRIAVVR